MVQRYKQSSSLYFHKTSLRRLHAGQPRNLTQNDSTQYLAVVRHVALGREGSDGDALTGYIQNEKFPFRTLIIPRAVYRLPSMHHIHSSFGMGATASCSRNFSINLRLSKVSFNVNWGASVLPAAMHRATAAASYMNPCELG